MITYTTLVRLMNASLRRNYSYTDSHGRVHEVTQDSRGRWVNNEVLPGQLAVLPTLGQHKENFQVHSTSTSLEMKTWLQKNVSSIHWDGVEKMHPEALHQMASQLMTLGHLYPEAFSMIERVAGMHPNNMTQPNEIAHWNELTKTMAFNLSRYSNGNGKDEYIGQMVVSWLVSVKWEHQGIIATATHEFGHVMDHWLDNSTESILPVRMKVLDEQQTFMPRTARYHFNEANPDIPMYELSKYGQTNEGERFAESFTAHHIGTKKIQQSNYMQKWSRYFTSVVTGPHPTKPKNVDYYTYRKAIEKWLEDKS